MPYTGVGTGIRRAIDGIENVLMVNDEKLFEFLITIPRSNYVAEESNQVKRPKLTKKQEDIINFCTIPRTSQDIMDRLGISNQQTNRERHITPLIAAGYLEMTNQENPTASNQKYRKKR